ncbi:Protein of unknown function DUF4192 [Candidatus Planktophila dulcis]|uniref:DUF4192 domain-containing protein n=1 Tax=Candidatus Planktophila dulcis TaxID=1884914 RepID=UPI003BEEB11E
MTTLTSPHDLLAAIPFLIGYHPQNSLVLVALKDEAVGMAMRVDMPSDLQASGYDLLASHFLRDEVDGAFVVAYVGKGAVDPENVLINISAALVRAGIDIKESLIVRDNRFRSMLCSDLTCCPPEGSVVPDLDSSRIAAEHVIAGHPMPFESVDGLVQSIAAVPSSFESVWQDEVHAFWVSSDSEEIQELQRDGATAIIDLAGEYREGRGAEDRELAARVIGRLSDIQVRDFALGSHADESADYYWVMWRDLLRIAPRGFVAPVACLFAAMAYERGEGALAHKGLDRALGDDDQYSLAHLLRRVFTAGWPPQSFSAMRAQLHPKVVAAIFG